MKNVAILGSTGSIGQNTLDVIHDHPSRFNVTGLSAGSNIPLLRQQIRKFKPRVVSVYKKEDSEKLRKDCETCSCKVLYGSRGAEDVASFSDNDIIVSAITGINGLKPTLAAVRSGKRVALANKESMVVAGALIQRIARQYSTEILPVDSEHSAVFQCLTKERKEDLLKVVLTASGGPFFFSSYEEISNATLEDALNHPRWQMGKKVTIDSATLMNKGLEMIEAKWLFNLEPSQLGILIHPQSIVHSLVEMKDGSILAQLSRPDMRVPIRYALTYPEREVSMSLSLNLGDIRSLEFYEVDTNKFPLVRIAHFALKEGASFPVALNAANEIVVEAFIQKRIKFTDITEIVSRIIESHQKIDVDSEEAIFEVDRETKEHTRNIITQRL